MDGILWNGWQGGLFRARCPQDLFPPGAGRRAVDAERGAKEGADGGGSVPTQRRTQRPGRAPRMALIAGRRPSLPPGGGKGGESNLQAVGRARALPRPGWGVVCPSQGGTKQGPCPAHTRPQGASKGRGAPCWTGRRGGRTGAVRLAPKPRTATRQPGAPPPAPLSRPAQAGPRSATGSPGATFSGIFRPRLGPWLGSVSLRASPARGRDGRQSRPLGGQGGAAPLP